MTDLIRIQKSDEINIKIFDYLFRESTLTTILIVIGYESDKLKNFVSIITMNLKKNAQMWNN